MNYAGSCFLESFVLLKISFRVGQKITILVGLNKFPFHFFFTILLFYHPPHPPPFNNQSYVSRNIELNRNMILTDNTQRWKQLGTTRRVHTYHNYNYVITICQGDFIYSALIHINNVTGIIVQ